MSGLFPPPPLPLSIPLYILSRVSANVYITRLRTPERIHHGGLSRDYLISTDCARNARYVIRTNGIEILLYRLFSHCPFPRREYGAREI